MQEWIVVPEAFYDDAEQLRTWAAKAHAAVPAKLAAAKKAKRPPAAKAKEPAKAATPRKRR